jgi:hypothetical protein
MLKNKYSRIVMAIFASALLTPNAHAAIINLSYDANNFADTKGQQALAGFQEAATFWETTFSDIATIDLEIDFAKLGTDVIAQARSEMSVFLYGQVAFGLNNDATSQTDVTAVKNLDCDQSQGNQPIAGATLCALKFLDQEGPDPDELDADGSNDNYFLGITQANAKALGFTTSSFSGAFKPMDAYLTFSSDFTFDFDRANGIDRDKMDFIGVAIHEMGHALGFISGVDAYDNVYNNVNSTFNNDFDDFAVASTLDLFRCSADSNAQGPGVLDWRPGADAAFSIDGCYTSIAQFSTGVYGGDGQQASHFKDGQSLGIMDPTFALGELGVVTANDLMAFDAIGWDLRSVTSTAVPEPASITLFGLAIAGLFLFRRKSHNSKKS